MPSILSTSGKCVRWVFSQENIFLAMKYLTFELLSLALKVYKRLVIGSLGFPVFRYTRIVYLYALKPFWDQNKPPTRRADVCLPSAYSGHSPP